MNEMKIRVLSPEHSKDIQEKLFSAGCAWAGVYAETYVRFVDMPYLFVSNKGIQTGGGGDICDNLFEQNHMPEYLFVDGEFKQVVQ